MVRRWFTGPCLSLLASLGCSGGSDGSQAAPPFTGNRPAPEQGEERAPGDASEASTNLEGTPAQNGALPLAPGGSAMPVPNGVAGMPPADSPGSEPAVPDEGEPPRLESVLVFTRTVGYRHDAIGVGVDALRALGEANGFAVTQTEEPAQFSDDGLSSFDVVVFLSTTSDVLEAAQQAAFERYIQAGGGWVGVHAAADTEYDWPWYGQLLGGNAWFESHPEIQTAGLVVEDAEHASTQHLPASFQLQDEWYNFQANPRAAVNVLMTLDESSYSPGAGAMGADHPIAWFHEFDGGRAWYTALGHRSELYQDPTFTEHLLGGIRWAAGVAP